MFVGGSNERHFRVVELDKKKVEIGGVSIKPGASPGSAARKLLTSIAHEKGLKKNNNKETTWCIPKNNDFFEEYTEMNYFEIGDILQYIKETKMWMPWIFSVTSRY